MKFVLVSFLVLVVLFLSLSCNEGYDYSQAALGLDLQDYSCTEAWIEVQIGSNDKTANIYIKKNDEIIQTVNVGESETLFYFDGLLPNTTYKFDAVTYEDGKEVKSNPVTFTTLDTTSHNFTWQIFEFGQHSSSMLNDVTIINENDIWAVGEIYMNDSLGNPDPQRYNAIHWNGQIWELKRIKTLFRGNIITVPLEGIFAFSSTDIWMVGSLPIRGDGTNWTMYDIRATVDPNLSLSKAWGSSSNDIFFIGRTGSIARYQNGIWANIESGTATNINDIWGAIDQSNNEQIVYGAVSFVAQTGDQKILKIQNNKVDSVHWNTGRRIHSVWSNNNIYLFAAGGGIFENKRGYWNEISKVPLYYSRNIRGIDNNNIFVCGDFGLFAHFNGVSWKTYNEIYIQGIYYSLSAKNNIVITVGFNGSKAIIIKGERN
ncbi:MAG: glucosyl transferase [Ignavibacterium sp.]|nr:glucosyl transferase [Ignavibacterium sp.]